MKRATASNSGGQNPGQKVWVHSSIKKMHPSKFGEGGEALLKVKEVVEVAPEFLVLH